MTFLAPDMVGGDTEVTRQQNRNYLLAEGFTLAAKASNVWSLFLRYQAQAERQYRRAIEEFDRLKVLRPELPIEPILDLQPEPTEPACPSSETNPMFPETAIPAPDPITPPQALAPDPRPLTPSPASGIRHPASVPQPSPRITLLKRDTRR